MNALSKIKEGDVCCEVGVWKGDFSQQILNKKPKELHLVDPWVATNRTNRMYYLPQDNMDEIYKSVVKRFQNNKEVIIYRKPSDQVEFRENTFDWVYIDGQHRYHEVLFDLKRFLLCVKNGGYIVGDDFSWKDSDDKGIKKAVEDFCQSFNQNYRVLPANKFIIQVDK